ncbi:MAG TPA: hypothetical protein VNA19_00070 [Pyrinomonadaceae bacterium]|jgi:hypothetical protein|nr:hypothetical protein [Pyrinomonadaceae bacterium]
MSKNNLNVWLLTRGLAAALVLSAATAAPSAGFAQAKKETKPAPKATTAAAPSKEAAATKEKKAAWRLDVSEKAPETFSLKATDAPLTEIAAELGRKLKVPVTLSPVMQKQKVTLDFSALPLDGTLRMLAPVPFVDYEVSGDFSAPPKPLAVYLYALNENPPANSTAINASSEALLIEGDTEEGTESYEKAKEKGDVPLAVTYTKNQLTVHAKKQPLTVVLYKIASEIGVPFDLRYESTEVVDVNLTNSSLDSALRSISPSVRFYYRTDLQNLEIQPLRIALVAPART